MHIILTAICFSTLLLSACSFTPHISDSHHAPSKYEKFSEQCDDWDQEICDERYYEMLKQQSKKKR